LRPSSSPTWPRWATPSSRNGPPRPATKASRSWTPTVPAFDTHPGGPSGRRRAPDGARFPDPQELAMRRLPDGLYTGSSLLAGLCMIGVLLMVTLMILGRLLGFPIGGADAYAGYAMAGAGFLALASTLKHGEHIRVTLVLSMLHGKGRRALEIIALLIAVALSG